MLAGVVISVDSATGIAHRLVALHVLGTQRGFLVGKGLELVNPCLPGIAVKRGGEMDEIAPRRARLWENF